MKWYTLAAKQGYASAQYNLGVMYAIGKGVPQNYKSAVKWFKLASKQGVVDAQYNLGVMYEGGLGVIHNKIYAHMWGTLAAANGHENGVKVSEFVANRMTPSQIEKAQDLARECVKKNYKGC